MSPLHKEILQYIEDGFIGSVSTDNLILALEEFDALYAGEVPGEEAPVTDGQYDALRSVTKTLAPTHKYFTGVGSQVRGGKVDLPYKMGSLDQVEIGDIVEWVSKHNLQEQDCVASDKMDGTSTLVIYDGGGNSQIAYSRGDGEQGADISRHIFRIKNVPTKIPRVLDTGLTIRAEVELTETAFKALHDAGIRRRGGQPYKNSRNMVAGLMNSKTIPAICYQHLTVICYEVLNLPAEKIMQLKLLEANGFQVVKYSIFKGKQLTDSYLADFLSDRKANIDYAIDGLVIEVNDVLERQRMNPTKDTLNPGYAIKYKVADASNRAVATVVGVTWNISKHGYLKPQVNLVPVDLVGVTITNATGFNAAFIQNSGIGPGAKVNLTRSGDVIPFITGVVAPAIPDMPAQHDWDWEWTYNEAGEQVDAKLKNIDDNSEVAIQQTLDFFSSIGAPHLKEGTVRKMFEVGKYTDSKKAITEMINYPVKFWVDTIGANGKKIHAGLIDKFSAMPLHILMGSLPFFGRGVGKRRFKKLEIAFGTKALHNLYQVNHKDIIRIEGFSDKTANKVLSGMDDYYEFYKLLPPYANIVTMKDNSGGNGLLDGQKICFTGFRNPALQQQVEEHGGEVSTSVSSKTSFVVAKDPNGTSGKLKTARTKNIKIISITDLEDMLLVD